MSFSMENQKNKSSILVLFQCVFMAAAAMAAANTTTIQVKVGVVVDLDEPTGKMYLSCIKMALSDFYDSNAHYKIRVDLNTRNSNEDVVGAADAASDLIKNAEVKAIIGPMTSMQASFVVNLGDKAHVPIISFSATSPSLTSLRSSYFFQFVQKDSTQVKAISDIVNKFGWRQVVPIYVDNMYGEGIILFLIANEKYDAVVGDATIRANRSLHVDFTMPYTESGVVMVVPIIDSRNKNAWVFLQPLTWDLWLTTLCFFIFIGFVIWVLEHRINEDFRGPPSHQVGTSFWFSFSTMVFSHRERVVSNLGRFVMIIWVFVVLIVTQSYTANLASLLTVQQLKPAVNDINDLLRNGNNVGYMEGSFVYNLLKDIKKFDDSKLKVCGSMEEIDAALSNGSIAAIVHETPYMKLLVAKYCTKYTMIGPIFKTDGFGFAFPKRSPLVTDISQAILNLTDEGMMTNIEDKWMKIDSSCENSSTGNLSSSRLGLESFWGLFLIAGIASIFSLLTFLTSFLYKHKHVLMPPNDSGTSKWKRIKAMFEIFNQKELSSQTLRSAGALDHQVKASSPNNNWPDESPQSYTNHTDAPSLFSPSHGQESPETIPAFELAFTIQETHETPKRSRSSRT